MPWVDGKRHHHRTLVGSEPEPAFTQTNKQSVKIVTICPQGHYSGSTASGCCHCRSRQTSDLSILSPVHVQLGTGLSACKSVEGFIPLKAGSAGADTQPYASRRTATSTT